jgi:hypothetical protein
MLLDPWDSTGVRFMVDGGLKLVNVTSLLWCLLCISDLAQPRLRTACHKLFRHILGDKPYFRAYMTFSAKIK